MSTPDSPDVFPRPTARGAGVRRLNRRPLAIVFGVFIIVCGVVLYTLAERTDNVSTANSAPKKPDPATSAGIFDGAPEAGLIRAATPPPAPSPTDAADTPTDAVAVGPRAAPSALNDLYAHEWQQYRQQQAQVRQAQMQAAMSALTSAPSITDFGQAVAGAGQAAPQGLRTSSSEIAGIGEQLERVVAQARAGGGAVGSTDENNAAGKKAWLDTEAPATSYLAATRAAPLAPLEIKTGTVIPGVMIGGINSDLPGQIIAQVRENVYDTRTGRALLIPQGARLIGTYDSQITRGQSRVLVAWTRIVFPDASSLELGSMPGADVGGYAGLRDKVNNHYFRVFGDAMLLSLFAAGIQLSQPNSSSTTGAYDSQQVMAAALGQQLGQAGMQLVQKNTNIQPTLEVRPGLRFNVMVTRDIILPPWSGS
ncbi:MAG: conjugal transfer protein TrbI [Burkholderiales bacterium]|nr:conjugal transfer protein TrbI [Burkholderiales bacterium]